MTRSVPAKIKPAAVPSETGREEVLVGDKRYSCRVLTLTTDQNGVRVETKTWVSDEVPGGVVKLEMTTTGQLDIKTGIVLQKIDLPKEAPAN